MTRLTPPAALLALLLVGACSGAGPGAPAPAGPSSAGAAPAAPTVAAGGAAPTSRPAQTPPASAAAPGAASPTIGSPAVGAASPAVGSTVAAAGTPVAASPAAVAGTPEGAPEGPAVGPTPTGPTGGLPLPTPIPYNPSLPPLALQAGTPYSLQQYLDRARALGVDVRPSTREFRVPYFTVVGASFEADGEQAVVWIYPNPDARAIDSAKIEDGGRIIAGQERPWRATPHFFSRGNLIVQFTSDNEATAEKLRQALETLD